jgi:hypothetical protein
MRMHGKVIAASALFALMSGTALAHGRVEFGFSIGVPAPVYVAPAPVYRAPPPVYYETSPDGYYVAPPQVYYYAAPAPYYDPGPGLSIRYRRAYPEYRDRHEWREHRRYRDDDDD